MVTNSSTGTYETVLTIAQSVTDVSGRYSCTVRNSRGTSAIEGTGRGFHCSRRHAKLVNRIMSQLGNPVLTNSAQELYDNR